MKKFKLITLGALMCLSFSVLTACGNNDKADTQTENNANDNADNKDNKDNNDTNDTRTVTDNRNEMNDGDNVGSDIVDTVDDVGTDIVDGVTDIGHDLTGDDTTDNADAPTATTTAP